jgi:hypothetical protein
MSDEILHLPLAFKPWLPVAVGLALALFILLDNQISDERFRTLTFFFMGCVAFLTIVIQGTTMKPLLQVPSPPPPPRISYLYMWVSSTPLLQVPPAPPLGFLLVGVLFLTVIIQGTTMIAML